MNLPLNIYSPWPGSDLVLGQSASQGTAILHNPNPWILGLIIFTLLGMIVLYRLYSAGLLGAFSIGMTLSHFEESSITSAAYQTLIFTLALTLPSFSYIFPATSLSSINYWWILALLFSFFVLRHFQYVVSAWITNKKDAFRQLEIVGNSCFLSIMTLSVALFAIFSLFPEMGFQLFSRLLLGICLIGIAVYFIRSYKIFISSGFSIFFWILYLCSLELLSICVVANVIVSNGH